MFSLEILDRYWLTGMPEEEDLCLHGEVRVHIGKRCCRTRYA